MFKKMDFPLYFQKVIWLREDGFYKQHFFLKKPNTLEYAQVLVVPLARLLSPRFYPPPPLLYKYSLFKSL